MRPSRFAEEQIVGMLTATFYKFHARFGSMEVSGAGRLHMPSF